ncbi:MAG: FkbM family methyltransferase [Planctomycetia bacterium]|nr:FkbM family methyltransferase [Planctomycetia bacterium]
MATFEAFNRQKACRHGQMLYNIHDSYIGRSLDLYGEYSEGEVAIFRQLVQPGNVVVDAGANIGAHTVVLAQLVGPTGGMLAFEPQRILYQTLCANLALNSIPNVFCFNSALGAAPGSVIIPSFNYLKEGNFGGLALGEYQAGEPVPVLTLDSYKLTRCDFLKADVEGMEQQVLLGASNTIARLRPILYVENDKVDKQVALVRSIDAMGYCMYWHLPYYFNPENFFNNQENVFSDLVSMNMLCLPKERRQNVEGLTPVQILPDEPRSPIALPGTPTAT